LPLQACANSGFNLFDVQINFSGSTLDASNQFIVELSNPQGDFSSPVILYTSAAGEIKILEQGRSLFTYYFRRKISSTR
jgi:hypothetical protein